MAQQEQLRKSLDPSSKPQQTEELQRWRSSILEGQSQNSLTIPNKKHHNHQTIQQMDKQMSMILTTYTLPTCVGSMHLTRH